MLVAEPPRLAHRSFDSSAPTAFHPSSASGPTHQSSMYSYNNHHQAGRPPPQLDAKVVILGSQGVGKTSMVHRYTVESFNPRATPSTIGAQFSTKKILCDGVKVRLQLWDTAGQERYKSMMPLYYRGSHAAVIVYDITSRQSFQDVKSWVEELRKNMADDLVIHIVGSKLDLAENAREVDLEEARSAIVSWFAPPPPPEPAPRPSTSTSSLLFFPSSSSTNEAASHTVSGLTRAVSTRLAGMRANSFTKSINAPSTLTRSKTAHVAVPGRTTSTGAGGTPPLIQPRGASMDALRQMPTASPAAAENGDGYNFPSASASMGRQNSLTGGGGSGGSRQILARMRTNSSINIFPSLLSSSSVHNPTSSGAGPCAQCEAATSTSSRSPSSAGGGGGAGAGSSSYCSHHTSATSVPSGNEDAATGSSSTSKTMVVEGPIMVLDGIELSEVSAKDDEGIEYVFNAIARKLVERRMMVSQPHPSGLGVSQGSGGGEATTRGSNMLGGEDCNSLLSAGDADSHLRRRGGGGGVRSGSATRQSILLHQPERDNDDDDDGVIEGIGIGIGNNDIGGMSGFGGMMHGGGSAFSTAGGGGGGGSRSSRPASVHLDRRGRDPASSWGSCCAT
ncbi:hypothetical protein CF327_g4520 [Tilletia walkeri]|uniref:Ras-domain-containing protein n=1 Tax=Tilletia walkeri TaxID=117179 RepID=A0A8X7N8H2_9BASI|nr:hypothetical protein CF327_g4520 [Tilletia walkeri]KAE8269122.1 hypothetical protein A4X09_0g3215 [Tilletia walkeri]